jgi:hypothetical protein
MIAALVVVVAVVPSAGAQSPVKRKEPPSEKTDCSLVLQKMRRDFAIDPGRLVLAMEDALTTEELCVCPIIRTAINLAGHDPSLTAKLVLAAIRMIPNAAARVTECALQEAPETAPALKLALAKELGEKSVAWLSEKSPEPAGGKSPVAKSPAGKESSPLQPTTGADGEPNPLTDDGFFEDSPAVGISGIYATSPARGGRIQGGTDIHSVPTKEIITTIPAKPRRPVFPITRDSPE